MEEGKTVGIQETRGPLREQDSIRALLELLEQQGMEQEKGDVQIGRASCRERV